EASKGQPAGTNFVRIPEHKVGNLFDLLGELIIMQSQQREDVQAVLNGTGDVNRINNNMARMERVTKDIQSIAMTLRMVSIKQTFQKILRIGMHTAKEVNKNIRFDIVGEETEVDRSIVEKLNDPLVHLIRNAVSHGIEEDPEERLASGKDAQGVIRIEASSGKGAVLIEVADDGKGIDPQKILRKALEKGLASPDREYTDKEIINFIFLPGFSTQEQVNNISGRGVGMNVVEEEIKKVGGKVDIRTEKGKGTAFILKIPINMATINGIVVDINKQRYVLPTMSIKRIFKPTEEDWVTIRGHADMVKNRGELLRLVPINDMLSQSFDLSDHIIMVIEYEGEVRALPVKEVIGKQEIVIKPLDEAFRHLDFLSGSTIMGDGTAALIFDVESFFRNSQ
ncbi:MAG: chemotaxis protein CheW, partial [Clostridia bacterium]|nr:chemotaxis protein CheW [Clostridia bacterium]